MDKIKFFCQLEKALKEKGVKDVDNILRDYEEIFIENSQLGISEEETINQLESPQEIAENYKDNIKVKDTKMYLNQNLKIAKLRFFLDLFIMICLVAATIAFAIILGIEYLSLLCLVVVFLVFVIRDYKNLRKFKNMESKLKDYQNKNIEEV